MQRRLSVVTLLVVGLAGACGPESPTTTPREVATYQAHSTFRVGESKIRSLTEKLDPDSPQRQILADGHVSAKELQQAWVAYVACIGDVGFTVSPPVWDPVTNVKKIYTYSRGGGTPSPSAAASAGEAHLRDDEVRKLDDCEARFWFPVSAIYAADTPDHLTPVLAEALTGCMTRRGYDVRGSTTFGQVVGARRGYAEGARVEAGRTCLSEAMAAHYPDLPYPPQP